MRDDSELDRQIDAALDTYADVDSGLEQRVLAHATARRAPIVFRKWAWAALLPVAAILLWLLFLGRPRPAQAPPQSAGNVAHQQLVPKAAVHAEPHALRRTRSASHRWRPDRIIANPAARLVKRDVFPTPQPLSPAERVLVDFATHAPEAERESFIKAQQEAEQPIAIADIRIAPIQIPPLETPQAGAN